MTAEEFPEFTNKFTNAGADEFVAFFAEGCVYVDGFYGVLHGLDGVRDLLKHVAEGGTDYSWTMHEHAFANGVGYARYVLRYTSKAPGHEGHDVAFEGMCQFTFDGGKVSRYYELFDRGVALAQMEFAPHHIAKLLQRWASKTRTTADALEA